MEPIELRLLDTEKNYDPSLVKELVCHYNHNQSTSISLEDFKHILDTIDNMKCRGGDKKSNSP